MDKLVVENLSFIYGAGTAFEKTALKNINLSVGDNEFLAIIGHTGSGKSTLIQHFNALTKPNTGCVLLDGFDINSDKNRLKEVRQKIGLVFQYPEHQLFEVSVEKDVAFGPLKMGLGEDEAMQRAHEALELVGIPKELYEKSPFELSGGEKRRAAIAGVLAMKPEILVLDEPTAGLDPSGRDEILSKIKKMHETLKISVVLVSHSMEDVAKLAGRVIVMSDGEIAFSGTPAEVFARYEELEDIGLAAPQISYLIHRLRKKGFNINPDIITVNEAARAIHKIITNRE